jgi:hypothetical protein
LFSRHFGDKVGGVAKSLGAEDESEISMKLK